MTPQDCRTFFLPLLSPSTRTSHSHLKESPANFPLQRHNSPDPATRLPTHQHRPNPNPRPNLRPLGPNPPRTNRALLLPDQLLLPIPQIPHRRARNRHDPRRRSEHHPRSATPSQRQPLRRRLLESEGVAVPKGALQLQ